MNVALQLMIAYLLGSIPFGYIIAKSQHIDIRSIGSGNIGATNINRALGFKYALVVGVLDIAKGFFPTLFALINLANQPTIALVALAAFLGHIFPIYLKFKGGKGVATLAGTLLAILGIKLFLFLFIAWAICLYSTKLMSLTNLILSIFIPFIFLIIIHSISYFIYALIVSGFIWWSHRENIKRLKNGTEKKLNLLRMHF